jgi:hypothetical protein
MGNKNEFDIPGFQEMFPYGFYEFAGGLRGTCIHHDEAFTAPDQVTICDPQLNRNDLLFHPLADCATK